jgi:hypothetical protein
MALGSTQPLKGISARNLFGCKGRPVREAENLDVICEPIVEAKCGTPRRHTTVWIPKACYRDTFMYFFTQL